MLSLATDVEKKKGQAKVFVQYPRIVGALQALQLSHKAEALPLF